MSDYRYEIKFSLEELGYAKAKQWLYINTSAKKKFDNRYVNSLYFDNPRYSSIKDNIAGISDREKYRLRWYDPLGPKKSLIPPCFEKKIRKGRLGRKESTPLNQLNSKFKVQTIKQIGIHLRAELNKNQIFFDDFYSPIIAVKYLREYFEDNKGLRITFDSEIEFIYVDGMTSKIADCPKLFNQKYVMELKFDIGLKEHASKVLKNLNMSPTRHSKYLMGLSKFSSVLYV